MLTSCTAFPDLEAPEEEKGPPGLFSKDSKKGLRRNDLINKINSDLENKIGLKQNEFKIVSRSFVPIKACKDTEIVSFRSRNNYLEYFAIILKNGNNNNNNKKHIHK